MEEEGEARREGGCAGEMGQFRMLWEDAVVWRDGGGGFVVVWW